MYMLLIKTIAMHGFWKEDIYYQKRMFRFYGGCSLSCSIWLRAFNSSLISVSFSTVYRHIASIAHISLFTTLSSSFLTVIVRFSVLSGIKLVPSHYFSICPLL